jgi:hypothetical protein
MLRCETEATDNGLAGYWIFLVWFEDRLRPTAGGGGKVPD